MNTPIVVTAVSTTISLLMLWTLVHWLYRRYRVDLFRQKIFALRDELFDLGRAGVIDFDHPAYGLLRTTMNGFIRFGHRIAFLNLVLGRWGLEMYGKDPEAFQRAYKEACRDLTEEQQEKLNRLWMKVDFVVLEQLVFSSPLLLVTMVPLMFLVIIHLLGEAMISRVVSRWRVRRNIIEPLESLALRVGAVA